MNERPGMMRRMYGVVALLAVINIGALLGLCGYGVTSGALDAKKLAEIGRVLRGESAAPAKPADALPAGPTNALVDAVKTAGGVESEEQIEMAHREAERIRTELEQRLALSNSILLKVREEREAFRKEREEEATRARLVSDSQKEEGFLRQVAIMESLSPKVAVEHLLSLGSVDESARILGAMGTARAKKIVESAKKGVQSEQMKAILRQLRETAPAKGADLAAADRE